jgi:hypothetical protein
VHPLHIDPEAALAPAGPRPAGFDHPAALVAAPDFDDAHDRAVACGVQPPVIPNAVIARSSLSLAVTNSRQA